MYPFLHASLKAATATILATLALQAAAQDTYPSKPIKIIVGVAPGGSTNNVARLVAQKLQESLGQPVIVENRTGANTAIATEVVARAVPDGYTLLVATNAHITIPLLTKMPYDPLMGFTPVGTIGSSPFVMSIHPSLPPNTLQEFIAFAKARPGQLNFGSSGSGGTSHMAGEDFNLLTGVRIAHIPYRGGGPSISDAIAGQVQVSYNTPMLVAPIVKAGRLKALAVTGSHRLAALPGVPTFSEAGLPSFDEKAWYGLFAPASVPKPIVDKLTAELKKMLQLPALREQLERQGVEPSYSTPEQFSAMMNAETIRLKAVIKAANIKLN